ncbi:metallo-beta-lactamase [Methanosarcina sp. 2.H.T.1A.6]|uniref:MBL fold metallo-hydrolase n=1 Tax=unclassified Methanosarcina TaxID=2644672 RepID=UPI0006220322|nr:MULTISPECIES: MBL fold metallo-hydrolase [unclassified Methanosarcina]KKG18005.1 metallo-beta-lactamase [Methanosarcina sp. 2.H.T.1A.3]KKG19955.1 metallo-beta-lactamase [Methanosarcina sp. 2.H.T.1A.6]KKG22619.1 metallo-beta-lactamase [Methanosarcina sp. 2.H.T.1A.8]KKG23677.1 metallo-beta-lactamase [Methanosarcina sp. 2.H.T.1A.15]
MLRLTVLYDNEAYPGFTGSWGFSALLETGREILLFDTGWDGTLLLKHMEKIGISPACISKLVLSHQHWDHIGGLPEILHANPGLTVYVPSSFSEKLKREIKKRADLVEVKEALEISNGVWSTGELGDKIKEQSLVLGTENGSYVLTGCAHPGIDAIMDAALYYGDIKGIIGGLHDSDRFERLKEMELIAAGHCTTHKGKIKDTFPSKYMETRAGMRFELQ